ncbi:MAG: carbohydrate-binding protein [Thermonemataceae bacterium]
MMQYYPYHTMKQLILLICLVGLMLPTQAQIKLNGALTNNGDVLDFSANSSTVVYRADQNTNDKIELFSVPIRGGTPTRINGDLAAGGDVAPFFSFRNSNQIGGSRVIYTADQDVNDKIELYSVPLEGGTPTKLSGNLAAGEDVEDFRLNPNNVVYKVNGELFSVPLRGGTPRKIQTGGNVQDFEVGISEIVYTQGGPFGSSILYSVRFSGTPVRLSKTSSSFTSRVANFKIEGNRVVYDFEEGSDRTFQIFVVPITGGSSTKLNREVGDGSVIDFQISGNKVVYLANIGNNLFFELFSVNISGGTSTKINDNLTAGGTVQDFRINESGNTVVYRADQDTEEVFELYAVPITGGASTKLNGNLATGGDVAANGFPGDAFAFSGNTVVYRADQDTDEKVELYQVPITGGASTKLSGNLTNGGNVVDLQVIDNNILYLADQDTDQVFELYLVATSPTTFDPYQTIRAIDFSIQNGTELSNNGASVGFINNGDWLVFNNVMFGQGPGGGTVRASSNALGGLIEFRIGSPLGELIAQAQVTNTGGWTNFRDFNIFVSNDYSPGNTPLGTVDIYLVFKGFGGFLFDVDNFVFTQATNSAASTISAYPNPMPTDQVTVKLPKEYDETTGYVLQDGSGSVIREGMVKELNIENNQFTLDFGDRSLRKGIYYLKIQPSGQAAEVVKLIKE